MFSEPCVILANSVKQKEKFNYIKCLKEAGLSLDFCKNLGFKASKHLWSTCLRTNQRKKGGRPKIKNEVQNFIANHLKDSSTVASNRTIKDNSGERINARYCDDTIKEAFKKFGSCKSRDHVSRFVIQFVFFMIHFVKYILDHQMYKNDHRKYKNDHEIDKKDHEKDKCINITIFIILYE